MSPDAVFSLIDNSENPEVKMDLKEYIRALGDHMLCEPVFDNDKLCNALDVVQMDIQEIRNHFNTQAPPGLEVVRDFMLESLELYKQSIDDMRSYITNPDRELLEMAILKSEEAEDIIGAIDQVIQEQRDSLTANEC